MAVSRTCAEYCLRGIVQYLNGDTKEFDKYASEAMKLHQELPRIARCKYKKDGVWVSAKVNFSTGVITDLSGQILRRGSKVCQRH